MMLLLALIVLVVVVFRIDRNVVDIKGKKYFTITRRTKIFSNLDVYIVRYFRSVFDLRSMICLLKTLCYFH